MSVTVTASLASADPTRGDGRFWVHEIQSLSDGTSCTYDYLADAGTDIQVKANARGAALTAQFAADAVAVPSPITSAQARRAISAAGLRESIEAVVSRADPATQSLWYTSENIDRDNPLVVQLGAAAGLTSDQIDALFRAGGGM